MSCVMAADRALARVVSVNFGTFRGEVSVAALARTNWASVTFTGARTRLRVELEGDGAVGAAADFLGRLDELDLPVPGHIVADLALVAEERRDGGGYAALELDALTIEDR
jgi:hypothetical protein